MNPDNKKFLLDMFKKYTVSVSRMQDDMLLYAVGLPDGDSVSVSFVKIPDGKGGTDFYYNAAINENVLGEVIVNQNDKILPQMAVDIIELMKFCSLKVVAQEALTQKSRFMDMMTVNKKQLS